MLSVYLHYKDNHFISFPQAFSQLFSKIIIIISKKNGFYHHDSIHSAFNDVHFTESEATLRLIILLKILINLSVNLFAKYDSLQKRIACPIISIS